MNVTFVTGAGASKDYGYPLGDDLKNIILQGSRAPGGYIYKGLIAAGNSHDAIADFVKSLFRSDYETIDQFIAAHKREIHIQQICKQAIVLSIARAENETALFNRGWHWYRRLIDFLRARPTLLSKQRFSFVTFNYDRSLEHYLHETVSRGGGDFSGSYLSDFFHDNFLHIHGVVGALPWQKRPTDVSAREYTAPIVGESIKSLAWNIVTPDQESALSSEWRLRILESEIVAFIGFGFHPRNCRKVLFDELMQAESKIKVVATTHNLGLQKVGELQSHPNFTPIALDSNNFAAQFFSHFDHIDEWLEPWRKRR